jgi:hypothetical protein
MGLPRKQSNHDNTCGKKEKGVDTNKQLHCSINYNVKKKKTFARRCLIFIPIYS